MERVVPYTDGVILGDLYDARRCDILRDCAYKFRETNRTIEPINKLESKFSLTESIDDICDVLMIPKEYALKVWTGHIINEGVKQALLTLDVPHSLTLMIRKTYVKKRVSLQDRDESLEESYKAIKTSQDEVNPTHWVKSIDIGDEIVVILHFIDSDGKTMQSIRHEIYSALETSHGVLDSKKEINLAERLKDMDRLLKSRLFKGLECKIFVFGFHEYDVEKLNDAATMLNIFSQNKVKWEEQKKYKTTNDVIKFKEFHAWKDLSVNADDLQWDSPEAKEYFNLLLAIYSDYPEASQKLQLVVERQEFSFMSEDARKLLDSIEEHGPKTTSTIAELDLRCIDKSHLTVLKRVSNDIKTVDEFIKRKTQQLPKGQPIQLILFGKTGHGASSTGNSILRKKLFNSYHSWLGKATTSRGSANVDSRLITCVDTTGIYDTFATKGSPMNAEVIQTISRCITRHSQGFHAILLVFAYGTRMTYEENICVEMLKSLFGEDILKTHVIIIMTRGDTFKVESKSFHHWLREDQNKYFKTLLEACNYRCVLFDNKTKDEKCLKEQLVILIHYIDSLGGVPYTNQMFKDAEKMRAEYFTDNRLLDNIFTSSCVSLYGNLKQLKSDEPISPSIKAQVNDLFIILGNPNKGTQIYNLYSAVWNVKNEIEVKRLTRDIMMKTDKTVAEMMTCLVETVDEINAVDEIVIPKVEKQVKSPLTFSGLLIHKLYICTDLATI